MSATPDRDSWVLACGHSTADAVLANDRQTAWCYVCEARVTLNRKTGDEQT